jgi:hypothetical protein
MASRKRLKKLVDKWENKLHNAGLGMGRGLSHISYGHDYTITSETDNQTGGGKKTPKRPTLSEIEKDRI